MRTTPLRPAPDFTPEEFYRLLADFSRDALWILDLDLRLLYMSPSVEEIFGFPPSYYIERSFVDFIAPESQDDMAKLFREVKDELALPPGPGASRGRVHFLEVLHRRKDGGVAWGEIEVSAFYDAEGRPRGIHGVTRNIASRKEKERAWAESEEKYRKLVEMLPIGVFECDLEGRLSYLNDAMFRMFGYPRDTETSSLSIPDVVTPEDWGMVRMEMGRVLAGEYVRPNTYMGIGKQGNHLPIEVHSAVIERDGVPRGFRGVIIDVSDKKRYEAELLKSNKLDALGLLAGGIAHDFNNMLAAVMGNINLAELELGDIKEGATGAEEIADAQRLLKEAEEAIKRARDLTSRLLTFSRGGAPVRETFSLADLVAELGSFNTAGSACRFEFEAPKDLPAITADRSQISQLVQNLVINAVQAMASGGRVRARLAQEGEGLRLDVDDEGPGVPEAIRATIFDPYFTTKPKGSGLGLAVSLAVARAHGGDITVGESPWGGARFSVVLPLGEEAACRGEAGSPGLAKPTDGLAILFMDDEEALRKLALELGERLGYTVEVASDVPEALALWDGRHGMGRRYDLAIVDLTIRGGPGGRDLLGRLGVLDPDLPVLVSSGYSEDPLLADWKAAGFAGLLRKPYDLGSFVATVEAAVESAAKGIC